VLDIDADALGPGIEAVLEELLQHRSRSFHDLAGGDLIRQAFRQCTDARERL
jgi:hypothetical protein